MSRARLIQFVCLLGIVLTVLGASLLVEPIRQQRRELELGVGEEVDHGMPADMALLTVATGAFRGIAIDILWYRANQLKDEGKYYEANQLSQMITRLQPRFPMVWAFHAWNMAYNISVATHTPEERWDWVNKGIRLLRDQGIPQNPNSLLLYKELGWTFLHKIGGFTDDMHWHYKRRLALEWQELLGGVTQTADTEQAMQRFREVAQAPDSLEEVQRQHPQVVELVAQFRAAGYEPDENLARKIGRIFMVSYASDADALGADIRLRPDLFDPALIRILQSPPAQALTPLLAYIRKKALIESCHMKPVEMYELMEQLGPLDWRHPASHAAYWSDQGVRVAERLRRTDRFDAVNINRQIIHAMQELVRGGKLSFDPVSGLLDLLPDPRFIPSYEKAVELAKQRVVEAGLDPETVQTYETGHENFMIMAATYLYIYGDRTEAQRYYRRARDLFSDPDDPNDPYRKPLSEVVRLQLREMSMQTANARQFMESLLHTAFMQGLANRRYEVYERYLQLAEQTHKEYQAQAKDISVTTGVEQLRMALLPFPDTVANTYVELMQQSRNLPLILRSRIWRNTPADLQRQVFARLRAPLYAEAANAQPPLNPALAFPAPPGWTEPSTPPTPLTQPPAGREGYETIERK